MNAPGFDALAKAVASRSTRRTALKRSLPAIAGLLGAAATARRATAQGDATPIASPAATGDLRVRKNVTSLTPDEKKAFVDAILAIKSTPSPWAPSISTYDQFVFWHREAFDCALMAAHMGPAFLPWHRAFLALFEEQLRTVDPSVTLPYWDWTVDNQPDSAIWQDDLMGGNGDPDDGYAVTTGPFRKDAWQLVIFDFNDPVAAPYIVRDLGAGQLAPDLPTAEEVALALAIPTYDSAPWSEVSDPATSFRNTLEGWRECAGDMCTADPFNHPSCSGSHDWC
jgi:tyrosinase